MTEDWMPGQLDLFEGPGQARRSDPATSHGAAGANIGRKGSARRLLLEAHADFPDGLTDEEAAHIAGVSLTSEYATRCSELRRMGALVETGRERRGRAGQMRMASRITDVGVRLLAAARGAGR